MTMCKFIVLLYLITTVSSSGIHDIDFDVPSHALDFDLHERVLDPELCQKHLQQINAFEFYDASFRIPQGLLKGNTNSLGNYDQCLQINQPSDDGSIRGKYSLIQTQSLTIPILSGDSWPANVTWVGVNNTWTGQNLAMNKQMRHRLSTLNIEFEPRTAVIDLVNAIPLTLGMCVPRACAVADVLDPLLDPVSQFIQFNYTVVLYRLPDDRLSSGADVAFIVIFSIIGFCTLLSTAYELNHIFIKKAATKPDELWSSFSVYGNTDRLLTLGSKPGALDCLDGIRSLSILWVILGHTFLTYYGIFFLSNMLDLFEWTQKLSSIFIVGGDVSVDSFLVLSGLLLVYTSAKKMKRMDLWKNLHLFYLHRLLRMFPLLAATVLLQASVMNQITDGVRWHMVAWATQQCRDSWWSTLLHIQNLVNPRQLCLAHTWYLSVDIQLHILSPLLLVWVLGSRRAGYSSLITTVLVSIVGVTIFCFMMNFPELAGYMYSVYFYYNTLARAPVFFIGMLCGYVLHLSRDKKINMAPWVVCLGYTLALVMSAYSVYYVHPAWESMVVINLNTALIRSAWAVSLCWLIVACVHGYGGPINWFLSIKQWKFVARISYAMYLLHYPMQFMAIGADSSPVYFSLENAFIYFASDVAYAVIAATAACVLIDAPFSTLIRRLMTGIMPKSESREIKPKDECVSKPMESINGNGTAKHESP